MNTFFQKKAVIAIGFYILGAGTMFGIQKLPLNTGRRPNLTQKQAMDPIFDQFYNDDFFSRSRDPFEEIRRMRERMLAQSDSQADNAGPFDSWYSKKFGGGRAGEIQKREDDKFVYFDIGIEGVDQNKLKIRVVDGQIEISGQAETKSRDDGSAQIMSTSFRRSFPAPLGTEPEHVQIQQEQNRLVVKMPKKT